MKIPTMIHLRGYLKLAVRGEHVEAFINSLAEAGIPVWDVTPTHSAELALKDFKGLRPLLKRTGAVRGSRGVTDTPSKLAVC